MKSLYLAGHLDNWKTCKRRKKDTIVTATRYLKNVTELRFTGS